jgi:hypothetical protein
MMRTEKRVALTAAWILVLFLAGVEEALCEQRDADKIYALMSGTVENEQKLPVEGAEISCWWLELPTLGPPLFTRAEAVVRSGSDGAFTLLCEFPSREDGPEDSIDFQDGFVVIQHPDFGLSITPWEETNDGLYRGISAPSEIPLELMPPRTAEAIVLPLRASASGTVRDSEGHPIAGAVVTASVTSRHKVPIPKLPPGLYNANPGPEETRTAHRLDSILSTTTDSSGNFTLDGLPKGQEVALHISHPEQGDVSLGISSHSSEVRPVTLNPATGPFDVTLPGAGSLHGRVVPPIEGQFSKGDHILMTRFTAYSTEQREVPIDSEGAYTISALSPGAYQLALASESHRANVAMVAIEPGTTVEAPAMVAGPGAYFAGTFTDAGTGEIALDVQPRMTLIYHNEGVVVFEPVMNEGRFEFNVRPGIVTFYVAALNGDVTMEGGEQQLVLKHGTRHDSLQFPFSPYARVSGTVVLPDGSPAAKAAVTMGPLVSTTSDADGRFTLVMSPAAYQSPRQTIFAALGNPPTLRGAISLRGGADEVTIRLDTPASVSGRLLDSQERPVVGFPIQVIQAGLDRGTRTDAEGKYRIDGLVPGHPGMLYLGRNTYTSDQPYLPGEHRTIDDFFIELEREILPPLVPVDVPSKGAKP